MVEEQYLRELSSTQSIITNWSLAVTSGMWCCLCVSSKSIIHRLSTDLPMLMWRCNYRTTTTRSVISTVVTFYSVDVRLHYS